MAQLLIEQPALPPDKANKKMGRQSVDVSSLESTRPQGRAGDLGKATYHWLQADSALGQRDTLETQLFARIRDLFGFECVITRYDLTNTLFSKEKRTDCPLLTLGLVLDGGGFPRHSQVLAGNVAKEQDLARCAQRGHCQAGQYQLAGRVRGYRYLVVSRERPP